jgi:hypothetical protein
MTDKTPTPMTDALIRSGPLSGPKEWIELWDRACDSLEGLIRSEEISLVRIKHHIHRLEEIEQRRRG